MVTATPVQERDRDRVGGLRDDDLGGIHELHAPAVQSFEVVTSLRYSGHYGADRSERVATSLTGYGLERHPFERAEPARRVASELDVTVNDTRYLAFENNVKGRVYAADPAVGDADHGSRHRHTDTY